MNQSNYKQNVKIKETKICVEDIQNEQNILGEKNPVTLKLELSEKPAEHFFYSIGAGIVLGLRIYEGVDTGNAPVILN